MFNQLLSIAILLIVGALSFLVLKNSSGTKKLQVSLTRMFCELDTHCRDRTVIMNQLVTAVERDDKECLHQYVQILQGFDVRLQTILREGHSSISVEKEPPERDRYNTYNPRPPFTNTPTVIPPGPPAAK